MTKPELELGVERELEALGPEQLRHLLAIEPQPESDMEAFLRGPRPTIHLPNAVLHRDVLVDWLNWRTRKDERRDNLRFWVLTILGVVAAGAAVLAAIEGGKTLAEGWNSLIGRLCH